MWRSPCITSIDHRPWFIAMGAIHHGSKASAMTPTFSSPISAEWQLLFEIRKIIQHSRLSLIARAMRCSAGAVSTAWRHWLSSCSLLSHHDIFQFVYFRWTNEQIVSCGHYHNVPSLHGACSASPATITGQTIAPKITRRPGHFPNQMDDWCSHPPSEVSSQAPPAVIL